MWKRNEPSKRASIKEKLTRILLFFWLIPLLILTTIMIYFVSIRNQSQVRRTVVTSMEKVMDIIDIQLNDCETLSKNTSYYTDIRSAYQQYITGGSKSYFATQVNQFLSTQYKYNKYIRSAMVVFVNEPKNIYYTYNNSTDATFKNIGVFEEKAKETILSTAKELDTSTAILSIDGRMYLVRNLMMPDFVPYAVLTLELNDEFITSGLESVWGYDGSVFIVNDEIVNGNKLLAGEVGDETLSITKDKEVRFIKGDKGYSYVIGKENKYGSEVISIVRVSNTEIYARTNTVWLIYAIALVLLIPLVITIWHFFNKEITRPVQKMVDAYDAIREEQYGFTIEEPAGSREFYYMQDSFNHMSDRLKQQFEKIYKEEIALRDAKIMALQSQINPHFLNNTLEIINWEARLGGNVKVSSMIESLAIMLEATMNRKGARYNSMAQEMAYVDAYIYIISQRLGEGFSCKKEIDETLLNTKIPVLSIQPIVENAVEHGISLSRKGTIVIRLYKKDEYICVEIENDGPLSEEDKEKIDHLLYEEIDEASEKRVSLGIRNVNRRIKMIYGNDCGLTIVNNEEGNTVSTITIKGEIET